MLQRDGLVVFESHRGATVVAISGEEVLQGLSARMWLEVLAVEQSAARRSDRDVAAARRALEEADVASRASDAAAFAESNRAFHQALEASADELLRQTIDDLWNRTSQARRSLSVFALRPEQMKSASREHEKIVRAVERGDAPAARAAMERHRLSSLDAWRQALHRPA
jgi:GntR family transcriptional repressor for pyruvate dehydrogenase complex